MDKTELIFLCVFAFFLSYRICVSLTCYVKNLAYRYKWIDTPNARSSHVVAVPRVGGLAIVASYFICMSIVMSYLLLVGQQATYDFALPHIIVVVCSLILAGVGFYDDLKDLKPLYKLAAQFFVAAFTVSNDICFHFGFLDIYGLTWLSDLISVFWIIGVINALNLIDGLDGLASGVAIIAAISLMAAQAVTGMISPVFSGMIFLGSILGFMIYNYHPASIFMGDCGSLFLGYFLATFALPLDVGYENMWLFLIPVCALGLPIFDTLSAFIRRVLEGRSPFSADKEHLHHRIKRFSDKRGLKYRHAIYSMYLISLSFSAFALIAAYGKARYADLLVLGVIVFIAILLYKYDYVSVLKKMAKSMGEDHSAKKDKKD